MPRSDVCVGDVLKSEAISSALPVGRRLSRGAVLGHATLSGCVGYRPAPFGQLCFVRRWRAAMNILTQ
jgi:hypothetical protein